MYVGDNIYKDIVPAKLNEIHSVYIHRGGKYDTDITGEEIPKENKPDYEISKLDELFDIINDLNKKFYIGKV
jgi:FMN phosphatase YigB (HAD superfamily)